MALLRAKQKVGRAQMTMIRMMSYFALFQTLNWLYLLEHQKSVN